MLLTSGIKAGWRFQKWGVFGGVAPGLASFDRGVGLGTSLNSLTYYRRTHFALQEGVIAEYYPSPHSVVRLKAQQVLLTEFDQVVSRDGPLTVLLPGHVANHLSVTVSAAYRWGERKPPSAPESATNSRFDLGALYGLHLREHQLESDLEPNGGVGLWGGYNFSRWGTVDATAFYLPHDDHTAAFQDGGQAFELYGGIKTGIRTRRVGYFAKFRPGTIRFARTLAEEDIAPTTFTIRYSKFYDLALDTGGVIEIYPSRHLVVRTDMGDDVIWYRPRSVIENGKKAAISGQGANSFLFLSGVGWRF